jgi:hypothetical protein
MLRTGPILLAKKRTMKKQLLTLLLCVGGVAPVLAQVRLLPKAGVSISSVAFDADGAIEGLKSRPGIVLGVGVNVPQSPILSFQTELLYVSKGFAAEENGIIDYDGYVSLNYLEVPILAKATFGTKQLGVYGNGGLSIGYLLGGRMKGDWDIFDVGEDFDQALEFTDDPNPLALHEVDANRVDVGLNVGGGLNFSAGAVPMFLDLRYVLGLTDYDKETTSKNRTFMITLGSQIGL